MPEQKMTTLAQSQIQYARLRQQLANLGWISEGYVQNRGPGVGLIHLGRREQAGCGAYVK